VRRGVYARGTTKPRLPRPLDRRPISACRKVAAKIKQLPPIQAAGRSCHVAR